MLVVSDFLKANQIARLPSPKCATPYLESKLSRQQIRTFFRSLMNIPFYWEDSVTSPNHLDPDVFKALGKGPVKIEGNVLCSSLAENQRCFHVSLLEVKRDPTLTLMLGYATIDDSCFAGYEWHVHAFCVNQCGDIIEPTPLKRDRYYGIPASKRLISLLEHRIAASAS